VSTNRKILVVSGIYPPDIGGPATYVPQICHHLVKNGFEVSLVSLQDDSEFIRESEPWKRTLISRRKNKLSRILSTVWVLNKESRGCQAIFANGLFEEVGLLKVLRPKLRYISKVVGDPVWERNRNATSSLVGIEDFNARKLPIKYASQRIILSWALNKADQISCPSVQLKEIIQSWNVHCNVTVIPNGIKCREMVLKPRRFDVITVSRLVSWKNLDKLISACARTKLSLAVCGDGPEMVKLKALSFENDAQVEFLGMLESPQVIDAINESYIFALISSYEGLSFALLEAMMAGKRILVSDSKGNRNVVKDGVTGLVVNPDCNKDLDSALLTLSENYSFAEQMSANAHSEAREQYCAENQLALMSAIITETCET
jgi:glycosyltransferase involved in cell wall biosynthesis